MPTRSGTQYYKDHQEESITRETTSAEDEDADEYVFEGDDDSEEYNSDDDDCSPVDDNQNYYDVAREKLAVIRAQKDRINAELMPMIAARRQQCDETWLPPDAKKCTTIAKVSDPGAPFKPR